MKRLLVSLLAVGLFVASPALLAQNHGDPDYGDSYDNGRYGASPVGDPGHVGSDATGYYDEARVIRVDPVLDGEGYAAAPGATRRCHARTSTDRDGRDRYDDDRYGYGRDPYQDDRYGYGRNPYDDDRRGYGGDSYYDRDRYGERRYGSRAGSDASALVGGVVGAVLGSKIGNGTGSYAAAAIGSVVGSMAGRQIYEQRQRENATHTGTVLVCDPEPVRDHDPDSGSAGIGGYDVTYEYNGRQYTRRMDYNPGDRIRVRVEVTAE